MDFDDREIPAWFWLVIDAAGHRFDVLPDSTQDLCTWVVGQGRALWARVASRDLSLSDAAQIYLGRVPGAVPWSLDASGATTTQSPWRIETTVYWNRFDEELLDVLNSKEILYGSPPDVDPATMPVVP